MGKSLTKSTPYQIVPRTIDEALSLAKMIASSDLAPKDYRGKPGNVIIAMQMGAEIGLSPLQALQNIAIINGRPSVWGDGLKAVVLAHPDCEWIKESFDDPNNPTIAYCTVKRKGFPEHTRQFSLKDASTAGLLNKGPWQQYRGTMILNRARIALRDMFADALRGLAIREEMITSHEITAHVQDKDQGRRILAQIQPATVDEPIEEEPASTEPIPALDESYSFDGSAEDLVNGLLPAFNDDKKALHQFMSDTLGKKIRSLKELSQAELSTIWDAAQQRKEEVPDEKPDNVD
jgi:hypothetical protein